MLKTLKQIRAHIHQRGLGITISELKKLCIDHHMGNVKDKIDAIENDYELMTRFFVSGFEDSQRTALYAKLEHRLYDVVLRMIIENVGDQNPTFKQCRVNALSAPFSYEELEETLSLFDQELALASLDDDADTKQKEIHQRLLRYRILIFNYIYTSMPWTASESDIMTSVLLSPLVDVIDKQIILGAMLMAQRTVFDVYKFVTLCDVARTADDLFVHERALVGIALGLPDGTDYELNRQIIDSAFDSLISKKAIQKELTDLQVQILLCMDTAKNEQTINNDILPTIMKNSKQMMGNQETDEEKLDALLNPDHEEKGLEEVEKAVDRMRNMQKNGADIFFSGFSQAKRFSFFYTLMNWFCPFYIEHPQIVTMNFKDMPTEFLEKIVVGQYFCNSDKYSFILSLAHVINQIPKEMLDMMKKGEMVPAFEDTTSNDADFIRRSYLNDLYRFYYLYSDKNSFSNPFKDTQSACFFTNGIIVHKLKGTNYPLRVCRQLLKRNADTAAIEMCNLYADEFNIEYLKIKALYYEHAKQYITAANFYTKALDIDSDNVLIVSRLANCLYLDGSYEEAKNAYQKCISLASTDADIDVEEYRLALCQLKMGEVDDGMKILFRLSYNDPEESNYRKALAWGYMLQGKFEEALNAFDAIPADDIDAICLLRISIAQWMNHKNEDAVNTLKRFIAANPKGEDNVYNKMACELEDMHLFEEYQTEAMILIDLAIR